MIKTGIFADSARLNAWIDAFKAQNVISGLACQAEVFEDQGMARKLMCDSIPCMHVDELISGDALSVFKIAEDTGATKAMLANVFRLMNGAFHSSGVHSFSLPLGLDRIEEADWPDFRERVAGLLSKLLAAPMPHDFTLELPVHFPRPFPASRELERALELCGMANCMPGEKWDESYGIAEMPPLVNVVHEPRLALAVHMRPDDGVMPDLFEEHDILGSVNSLSFHYDVEAGETLFDDEQAMWATNLGGLSYAGSVVFRPLSCPDGRIMEICSDAAEWAALYNQPDEE